MAMYKRNKIDALFICLIILSGCTNQADDSRVYVKPDKTPDETVTTDNNYSSLSEEAADSISTLDPDIKDQITEPDISIGTDNFINKQKSAPDHARSESGEVTLNFQGVDIREFVQAVLGELLEENYVIDKEVSGIVSIQTARPLVNDELIPVLEHILAMNGAALNRDDGMYHIIPRSRAARGTVSPTSRIRSGSFNLQVVPLRYIGAAEMEKILSPLMDEQALINVDSRRNLLILAGTEKEISHLLDTIELFDVNWLEGMSVGLFPLEYADPESLVMELEQALEGEDGTVMDGLVRLIPIERLGALLVVSPRETALRQIHDWVNRLDRAGKHAGRRIFVYKLQNAKSADVANILSQLFDLPPPPVSDTMMGPSLAPGTMPTTLETPESSTSLSTDESSSTQSLRQQRSRPQLGAQSHRAPGSFGGDSSNYEEDTIRIIADEVRNSLVILATNQEYDMVKAAVERLDTIPLQVNIEASIIEVTLTDTLEYGVEWFFKNDAGGKQGRGLLDLGGGLAPAIPGFSYAIVESADDVRVILTALAEESKINMLSSPSLMVLDNQTATISVGDEIPLPTRQAVSVIDPEAPTVNEVQYRNTGVILEVTPRVNAGGLVTMEIRQEVSDAVTTTSSALDAPTIQQREIQSTVAIQSGDTIVLGGLIRDSRATSESGIPFIRNIPLLGKLFGQSSDFGDRTELMVLITPRAIDSRQKAQDVTNEFRRKLQYENIDYQGRGNF